MRRLFCYLLVMLFAVRYLHLVKFAAHAFYALPAIIRLPSIAWAYTGKFLKIAPFSRLDSLDFAVFPGGRAYARKKLSNTREKICMGDKVIEV